MAGKAGLVVHGVNGMDEVKDHDAKSENEGQNDRAGHGICTTHVIILIDGQ